MTGGLPPPDAEARSILSRVLRWLRPEYKHRPPPAAEEKIFRRLRLSVVRRGEDPQKNNLRRLRPGSDTLHGF